MQIAENCIDFALVPVSHPVYLPQRYILVCSNCNMLNSCKYPVVICTIKAIRGPYSRCKYCFCHNTLVCTRVIYVLIAFFGKFQLKNVQFHRLCEIRFALLLSSKLVLVTHCLLSHKTHCHRVNSCVNEIKTKHLDLGTVMIVWHVLYTEINKCKEN